MATFFHDLEVVALNPAYAIPFLVLATRPGKKSLLIATLLCSAILFALYEHAISIDTSDYREFKGSFGFDVFELWLGSTIPGATFFAIMGIAGGLLTRCLTIITTKMYSQRIILIFLTISGYFILPLLLAYGDVICFSCDP